MSKRRKRETKATGTMEVAPGIGYKDSIGEAYKLEQAHPESRQHRRAKERWIKKGKPKQYKRMLLARIKN